MKPLTANDREKIIELLCALGCWIVGTLIGAALAYSL